VQQLLGVTAAEHADRAALAGAVSAIGAAANGVRTAQKDAENFARLLEIQASFVGEFKVWERGTRGVLDRVVLTALGLAVPDAAGGAA
jgi:hypothetical protein